MPEATLRFRAMLDGAPGRLPAVKVASGPVARPVRVSATARIDAERVARRCAATGWAVFLVTLLVVHLDPPSSIDHDLQGEISRIAPAALQDAPWLRSLSLAIAHLGSAAVGAAGVLVIGGFCAWRHHSWSPGRFLAVAYCGMVVSVNLTKRLLHRPEPYDWVNELGRSFPSGHSATAMVLYGGLAALIAIAPGPRSHRTFAVLPAALMAAIAVVMIGRSAHWLSDVVGGLALGLAWLGTSGLVVAHVRSK